MLLCVLGEECEIGLEPAHAAVAVSECGGGGDSLYALSILHGRLLLLLTLGLLRRGPNVAGLALRVQLHDLLDQRLVDLEQRVDALLLARLCDGRHGRLRNRLHGRLGHGLRRRARVHRLRVGGHAGRLLCRRGIGGRDAGVTRAGRRRGLTGLRIRMGWRREGLGLGKGRARVGAR